MSNDFDACELYKAMFEIQGELDHRIGKDSTANTGKYTYDYTKIEEVADRVKPLAQKHGVLIIQGNDQPDEYAIIRNDQGVITGSVLVVTRLVHVKSGAWHDSVLVMPVVIYDPDKNLNVAQEVGKLITYARRYSLVSLFFLTPVGEDNDANGADTEIFNKKFAPPANKKKAAKKPGKAVVKKEEEAPKKVKASYEGESVDPAASAKPPRKKRKKSIGVKKKTLEAKEDSIDDMAPAPKQIKRPKKVGRKKKSGFPKPGPDVGEGDGAFNG